MVGQPPFGEWELALPHSKQVIDWFKNEMITEIFLIVSYEGRIPPWPA